MQKAVPKKTFTAEIQRRRRLAGESGEPPPPGGPVDTGEVLAGCGKTLPSEATA
jgi:hypothetical protein